MLKAPVPEEPNAGEVGEDADEVWTIRNPSGSSVVEFESLALMKLFIFLTTAGLFFLGEELSSLPVDADADSPKFGIGSLELMSAE